MRVKDLLPLVVPVLLLGACVDEHAASSEDASASPAVSTQAFLPLVRPAAPSPQSLLGRALFFDTRLSGDGSLSCASCHDLKSGGDDGRKTALGIRGQLGPINTPTVLNSGLQFALFWDGRAATLEEQARGPVANPAEMGAQWPVVLERLLRDPAMVSAFAAAFEDGEVSEENVVKAIAAFERQLVTDSPFDRFLRGEGHLENDAEQGLKKFQNLGCVACHQGRGVGGNMFQLFGVADDYWKDRGDVKAADNGRYNVTHLEEDRHLFKVPTLRNVAETAPYFHDGSAADLDEAVRVMGRYQLGLELDDGTVAELVAFLRSLSGEVPAWALAPAPTPSSPSGARSQHTATEGAR